jgi:ribosomal protein S27E
VIRCPACGSVRVVVVVSPNPRAFCGRCGAAWVQDHGEQREVRSPIQPPSPEPPVENDAGPIPWASA